MIASIGNKEYVTSGYTYIAGTDGFDSEGSKNLIDSNLSTKWCTNASKKTEGVWFVEFQTQPIADNGNDDGRAKNRRAVVELK